MRRIIVFVLIKFKHRERERKREYNAYKGNGSGIGSGIIFFFVLRKVNKVRTGESFLRIFLALSFLMAWTCSTWVPMIRNISRRTTERRRTPGVKNRNERIVELKGCLFAWTQRFDNKKNYFIVVEGGDG